MAKEFFGDASNILNGIENNKTDIYATWNSIVSGKIKELVKKYDVDVPEVNTILETWHKRVTLDYKHDQNFSPHVNGFYMIFMIHGPWYSSYMSESQSYNMSDKSTSAGLSVGAVPLDINSPNGYFNMLATDIDIPDITEEYISVSSRLRNSFIPNRNYFVSDFSISYIESTNLDVMRYHESWHKYMNLLRRGETSITNNQNSFQDGGYFIEIPYANAVWVAVFRPFTTDIQMLVKLVGVMPVTMPLKQVVGNRSASKMTVLNISYKASDLFYKFYDNTKSFLKDNGALAKAFKNEVLFSENNITSNQVVSNT